MNFTTPVSIPKNDVRLNYHQPIFLMGSCFTENIGNKLKESKLSTNINPLGIVYNPIALARGLKRVIKNQLYTERELTQFNNKWISFDHHGSFSSFNKDECLNAINNSLENAHNQFKECSTIIVTLGSAWGYEHTNAGIVANCHKIPSKEFKKRLLTVKEIISSFEDVLALVKTINPNLNFIFTVSPVRHVKDGLHENNLSKSTLHLAINNLVQQHPNCSYFPAYEIIIDELRDYRFYNEDMAHPTHTAIKFVWEKFVDSFFTKESNNLLLEIQKLNHSVNHRPFNYDSEEHQQFISKQIKVIETLSEKHPLLNFEKEKKQLLSKP